jgi:hypothetical protein
MLTFRTSFSNRTNAMKCNSRAVIVSFLTFIPGCGDSAALPTVDFVRVPVNGRVVMGRKPVAGAIVEFEPRFDWNPDLPKPRAISEADGSFELGTVMTGDGAPAGEYGVSIASPATNGSVVIDHKFADAAMSGLKATVQPQPTKLPDFVVTKASGGKSSALK